ncbi:NosD domain-containing protein [Natronobiforma cellulositropha]|uniref:NosD domain-containing protein n=1 Tax=Natronobiforma cellulositropha TaxID=1679076 RepID=UPI0021D5ED02|nr:NosD domain-containing protein [Natronobiforma cellulositropha]
MADERVPSAGSCSKRRTRDTLTRRRALGLLGSGLVLGAVGRVGADGHDADVWREGGTWYAEAHGTSVYSGSSMFGAVQSAIDGLSSGRTAKETVVIHDGGSASGTVYLPSYTALEFREHIDHGGGDMPFYADREETIEISSLSIDTSAGMGMRIQRCYDVTLGTIEITGGPGIGIRIDGGRSMGLETTEHVRIGDVYVERTGSHGVETYNVHDIEIGVVQARDTGGSGLLLNDTSSARVGVVDAVRANEGGGYAGFRCANDAGPDIHVDLVRSIDCGRGVFTVSGSHGITIEEVYLEGNGGNLIQDSRDVQVNGGTVVDNGGEGFRIDSRSDDRHPHTREVTIQNCVIRGHNYGVRETGPDTEHNAILDNDFCDNGTDIDTYASNTVVDGNTYCEDSPGDDPGPAEPGDGGDPGTCEPSAITPYLRVDGGDWAQTGEVTIEPGATVEFGPHPHTGGSWSWAGPDVDSSSREIEVSPAETATYTATHTNACGATSGYEYTVVVEADQTGPCNGDGIAIDGYTACDITGDGLHEDVTGDGRVGFNDVVTFFEQLDEPAVAGNPDAFDFSGNGQVGFTDVVALFERL